MKRRSFLTGLATLIGGSALDPERLLWVPGKKLISIPKPGYPRMFIPACGGISNEALRTLFNPVHNIYEQYEQHRKQILESVRREQARGFVSRLGA